MGEYLGILSKLDVQYSYSKSYIDSNCRGKAVGKLLLYVESLVDTWKVKIVTDIRDTLFFLLLFP